VQKLRDALPKNEITEPMTDEVEEVEADFDAELEDFGAGSGDPRAGGGDWEDEEEEGGPQCAPQ
jgi:DnaJ family protein A protein 2